MTLLTHVGTTAVIWLLFIVIHQCPLYVHTPNVAVRIDRTLILLTATNRTD